MRRSIRDRVEHGPPPGIAHHDVTGKAFALLLVFALALGATYFAGRMPPRQLTAPGNVVNAEDTRAVRVQPASAVKPAEITVLGLDCLLPHPRPSTRSGAAVESALDAARDAGQLRGYSLPPRRLAFTPEGEEVYLPPPPTPAGPCPARVVFRGNRDSRKIALTFDTSEVSEKHGTRALIDTLTRLRAPATFFVCGEWCYKNPDLLKLLYERGFEVASHSFDHPMFSKLTNAQITAQLKETEQAVKKIAGARIAAYCRTPYGEFDPRITQVLADNGYTTVLWNTDTLDWQPTTIQAQIRDRATANPGGGDIILMHTTGKYTRDAQIEIVNNLRANGFELTTLSGVLQP